MSAAPNSKSGLNNRFQSYQHGTYQPPPTFAEHQTDVLVDTMKTQYAAEGTANAVLTQLTEQRHQLSGAHENVWQMRTATDNAKRELQELHNKYQSKKLRLYATIAALGLVDLLLFFRIAQCRGSFFC